MVRKAEELCAKNGWFLCHQFENEANWKFHEATTGPEIIADFKASGKKLCGNQPVRRVHPIILHYVISRR